MPEILVRDLDSENVARRLSETWHRRLAQRSFSDSAKLIREGRETG